MRAVKFLTTTALAAVLAGTAASADVTISSKPTANMSCASGVCSPTAKNAVVNVSDLAGMLAGGDVTVNTGDAPAKGIAVKTVLSWTSTNGLALDAIRRSGSEGEHQRRLSAFGRASAFLNRSDCDD